MDNEREQWNRDTVSFGSFGKAPMSSNVHSVSSLPYSKRKLSGQEKPRKILRSGTTTAYERRNAEEVREEDQVEQNFSDALDIIAAEAASSSASSPLFYQNNSAKASSSLNYPDKKVNESVSVETRPVHCEPLSEEQRQRTDNQSNLSDADPRNDTQELKQPKQQCSKQSDLSPTTDEPCLGPQAFGLVPVQKPPQANTRSSPVSNDHSNSLAELEQKVAELKQQVNLLQNKHDLLQESHDKLAQLVEAQNHLLACHTAPPPTREALANFTADESALVQSPDEQEPEEPEETANEAMESEGMAIVYDTTVLPRGTSPQETAQTLRLPRRVTARDIIRLWEQGSRSLPPVKNWSPAQKMKVQSKLSRWKKIIDIFKTECNGDMETFEQMYSGESGDLLPVTTILALHENQLSSEFLSKGFTNSKLNTIELKSPTPYEKDCDQDNVELKNKASTTVDDGAAVEAPAADDEKTNRYVLPRKVTARDVVQLWDSGCADFPAISTWTKAQKIGQETKIFRWRKIVDIFKKDCASDWDLFTEKYSNDKGELLPLATIIAKHDAMSAEDQLTNSKQTAGSEENDDDKSPKTPKTPTTSGPNKTEKTPRDPNCVVLPRKVTAFEVVRYWTDGSEAFPPVKDWTRAQKMGQETKISRWKKIYDIFRYQCHRDWDEFCRRYTNQRGELLPVATILGKYELEHPAGTPSYQVHVQGSPGYSTSESVSLTAGIDADDDNPDGVWALAKPTDISVTTNDDGEYVLPAKLSPIDALCLWEHGTEDAPPIKTWTEEQAAKKSLFATVRHLAEIFESECGGHFRRFVERFSDTDGELLPIAGIIYSSEARKYSPYFTVFEKSIKQSRSRGQQYELPKRVGAKEIVWLWEHGCRDFPPVKAWSSAQKLRYTTKLSRWRKIVDIFHQKCDSNWRVYEEKYSNASGELLAISTVISMQDDTEVDSYASMIKKTINSPNPDDKMWTESATPGESLPVVKTEENAGDSEDHAGKSEKDEASEFCLPRKVNALDIINFWECGFGNMPPVAQWSPLQKFRQRSKISRWSKIYDIYKNHCRGNITEFEKLYSDKNGVLLPATTIISMYESRVDGDSLNDSSVDEAASPSGPIVRRYVLPRKVDAKDIVRLWTKGNHDFPPIASWSKADKIGQETKIFRWKKIVDIFKHHCGSDWDVFEELFANEYGELLPTSAIIAKYETTCNKD